MITERRYIRTQSLSDVHEEVAKMEADGWQKASPLMYTHDENGQGWEMAMHRAAEENSPPPDAFVRLYHGFVGGFVLVFVSALFLVACVSVMRWLW